MLQKLEMQCWSKNCWKMGILMWMMRTKKVLWFFLLEILKFIFDYFHFLKIIFSNDLGRTALHYSVQTPSLDTTKALINNGANIDALDYNECSPAHFCAQIGQMNQVILSLLSSTVLSSAHLTAKDSWRHLVVFL